jgi:hypothetical protein
VITRKLKEVNQALGSITTQDDLAQFLSNSKNSQELNGLVEDIHDAFIGYQVCPPILLTCIASNDAPDLTTTRYL